MIIGSVIISSQDYAVEDTASMTKWVCKNLHNVIDRQYKTQGQGGEGRGSARGAQGQPEQ